MFSRKPQSLLYLKKSCLQVYYGASAEVSQLEFPNNVVSNLELIDPDGLQALVKEALASSGLKGQKALLVLDNEVLFQKIVPAGERNEVEAVGNQFYDTVPLAQDALGKLNIEDSEQVYFFASNAAIYETIVTEFENFGWQIVAVTPLIFFADFGSKEVLDRQEVRSIISNFEHSPAIDFLHQSSPMSPEQPVHRRVPQNIFVTLVLLLLLAGVVGGAFWSFDKVIFRHSQPTKQAEASPSPTISPSPSPLVYAKKDELKIQVFNGTGTPGEASKVKTSLNKVGYLDVDTSNANKNGGPTTVQFSSRVSPDDQAAITSELKKLFTTVTVSVTDSRDHDVIITTGK